MDQRYPARGVIVMALVALVAGAVPAAATHQAGLIAYYPLDGTGFDATGHGHDGTAAGSPPHYAAGKAGSAFFCDDADNLVTVPDSPDFTLGGDDFSITLWAQFAKVLLDGHPGFPGEVMVSHDEGGGTVNKWMFAASGSGLSFHVNGPVPGSHAMVVPFVPNEAFWHHLALTRSGDLFTFYVDGVSAGSVTNSVVIPDPGATLNLCDGEGFRMGGLLDDVRIYDRALTQGEIGALSGEPPWPLPEMGTLVLTALGVIGLGAIALSRRRR